MAMYGLFCQASTRLQRNGKAFPARSVILPLHPLSPPFRNDRLVILTAGVVGLSPCALHFLRHKKFGRGLCMVHFIPRAAMRSFNKRKERVMKNQRRYRKFFIYVMAGAFFLRGKFSKNRL